MEEIDKSVPHEKLIEAAEHLASVLTFIDATLVDVILEKPKLKDQATKCRTFINSLATSSGLISLCD